MSTQEIILAIGGGLLVNEFCDISPWAARKIVTWSARLRYGKSARAEIRVEEYAAVIDSRPGKLFKLITALTFATGATGSHIRREALLFRLLLPSVFYRVSDSHTVDKADDIRVRYITGSDGKNIRISGKNGVIYEYGDIGKSAIVDFKPSSVDPD
ncbi:hypothetical protein AB0L53_31800 [Nonomuraea sp. NPDC052129]|uniref:hypothetical protein n=1 Tax=Nonomuraea sp. NPDC052129 TaxID=3154651 RepID=UPI003424C254